MSFLSLPSPSSRCPPPPASLASPKAVSEAVALLGQAQRPLVIVGKGAAYGRAEEQVKLFIQKTGLPFLPTPMGMYSVLFSVVLPSIVSHCLALHCEQHCRSLLVPQGRVCCLTTTRSVWRRLAPVPCCRLTWCCSSGPDSTGSSTLAAHHAMLPMPSSYRYPGRVSPLNHLTSYILLQQLCQNYDYPYSFQSSYTRVNEHNH